VLSVGFSAVCVWDVACCCQCNHGGDDSMRTITAQLVLGLSIIWLTGVDVKLAAWVDQCGAAMEFIYWGD